MAKQEVEDGRLIRRKKESFNDHKFPRVTPLGNLGQTTPGVNDLTVGDVVGGTLLDTDGALTRDDRGINQELQELKDKYEQLVEALRARGIYLDGDGEFGQDQIALQQAIQQQVRERLAPIDTEQTAKFLAELQELRERPHG